jgi:hypothetical protein
VLRKLAFVAGRNAAAKDNKNLGSAKSNATFGPTNQRIW